MKLESSDLMHETVNLSLWATLPASATESYVTPFAAAMIRLLENIEMGASWSFKHYGVEIKIYKQGMTDARMDVLRKKLVALAARWSAKDGYSFGMNRNCIAPKTSKLSLV